MTGPDPLFDIAGRSIVVTGASGAFGRAAAQTLAARGARLTLVSGDAGGLQRLAEDLPGHGHATLQRRPDTLDDAQAIADAAIAAHGRIDGLVVASGTNHPAAIGEMTPAAWQTVMDANVRAPWLLCKAIGPHFAAQGHGKVVFVSSVRGRHGTPRGYTAYCTSKAALDGLTRTLATEWGPQHVNVNAIGPTVFRSNLTAWMFGDDDRGSASRVQSLPRIPLGRLGEPGDLMGILVYLLAPASDFCTGQVIYVDGGYTAG